MTKEKKRKEKKTFVTYHFIMPSIFFVVHVCVVFFNQIPQYKHLELTILNPSTFLTNLEVIDL